MTDQKDFDDSVDRRRYGASYTPKHPVPTVQKYRDIKQQRNEEHPPSADEVESEDESKTKRAFKSVKGIFKDEDVHNQSGKSPYPTQNRNVRQQQSEEGDDRQSVGGEDADGENSNDEVGGVGNVQHKDEDEQGAASQPKKGSSKKQATMEDVMKETDPKKKRKNMKHWKADEAGREVTDPVTHLPITIHDSTKKELKRAPENEPAPGSKISRRTSTGLSSQSKSSNEIAEEKRFVDDTEKSMQKLFPPPSFDEAREKLAKTYQLALAMTLVSVAFLVAVVAVLHSVIGGNSINHSIIWATLAFAILPLLCGFLVWGISGWLSNKVKEIWEDEVWGAAQVEEGDMQEKSDVPESVQWLNSLLSSVWPLINPDLFTSMADTLEDVMQASLPKVVRMISVEDLGQGSESLRVLGISWLPTGKAAESVSADGKVLSGGEKKNSDRTDPEGGEMEKDTAQGDNKEDEGKKKEDAKAETESQENLAEGMEAEQGDFVNMEVAFAYRARPSSNSVRTKAKNAHLYLAFYLPGGIKFPVWVEMKGIVGRVRMRLQLTPDPPFFSLATITFLGQPRADLSCMPLTKKGINILNLPLISSFVQSSIDAALAEYVAPKSLTVDLKNMLMGDDFKKDTTARGVVVVHIKSAEGFKEGDGSLGPFKKGSADGYVTVGWAKFGKPVASTRVIFDEMHPIWDEQSYILVGPEELNAQEQLRVQLWDSDRTTADDSLGRVELDLKEIMKDFRSQRKMWDREDSFIGSDIDEKMPGTLSWSVGYYPKTRILPEQLAHQKEEPDIHNVDELKQKVGDNAERKLREAKEKDPNVSEEIEQQKAQDFREREEQLIISSPPPQKHPSGILSIVVHQITGLEFERLNKKGEKEEDSEDEREDGDDLPSAYCNIILNHEKIFKTRTKPKNAKPFFNAGTERFIRDWRNCEVMLSCRDSRVHEDDPLMGIVYLPLGEILKDRSQVVDSYPLVGGIGYGRARVSIVFRSIQLQAPRELLGWEYGTVELTGPIKSRNLPHNLRSLRLKARTNVAHRRYHSHQAENDESVWEPKHGKSVCLAVRKRYRSCLVFEFRKNSLGGDKTPAFAVLWLKDIPDDEEMTVTLAVHSSESSLKRAETCAKTPEGKKLGDIEVPLKFWHGLSGYHRKVASKNQNVNDVMECLDVANDNKETNDELSSTDEGSDSDDPEKEDTREGEDRNKDKHNQRSGSRGPIQQIKDYRDHRDQMHRQHRGLMQWKVSTLVINGNRIVFRACKRLGSVLIM